MIKILTISERGQLVIPQEVRKKLDLSKGRKLSLELSEDGRAMILRPAGPPKSLRGFLKGTPPVDRMLGIVRAEERRRDERRRRS